MFLTNCTCCGTELTKPQFFEGKAYGMSCIKNVNPAHKVNKKIIWVKAYYEQATHKAVCKLTGENGKVKFVPWRDYEGYINKLNDTECLVPAYLVK